MALRWDEDGDCYIADDAKDLMGWSVAASWPHKENLVAAEITRTCGDGTETRRVYIRCGESRPWLVYETDCGTHRVRGYVMARTKQEAEEVAGVKGPGSFFAGLYIKETKEYKA